MEVVLIDSGGANIGSVQYALERLGARSQLTADAAAIARADRVILPGVGAAGAGMARLRELGLVEVVRGLSQPLLGICLGMQLLFDRSEENETECLGLIPGAVRKLTGGEGIRVPHMGWNALQPERDDPLLAGMSSGEQAYFVHSYAAPVGAYTLASTTHGEAFSAIVRRDRCWGAQFHPERSATVGARLLENFLSERLA
ncbi:imidazole glycerol phosphate synthase subunit HisH [Lysobacter tyrosinilyticus]